MLLGVFQCIICYCMIVLPITYKRMLNFSVVFQGLKMEGSNSEYELIFLFEGFYLHKQSKLIELSFF